MVYLISFLKLHVKAGKKPQTSLYFRKNSGADTVNDQIYNYFRVSILILVETEKRQKMP